MKMSHTNRENLGSDLMGMRGQNDKLDNLHGKDIVRKTVIGQGQKFYNDQSSKKPNPKRAMDHVQPSGYFQGQVNVHMRNVIGCYYKT